MCSQQRNACFYCIALSVHFGPGKQHRNTSRCPSLPVMSHGYTFIFQSCLFGYHITRLKSLTLIPHRLVTVIETLRGFYTYDTTNYTGSFYMWCRTHSRPHTHTSLKKACHDNYRLIVRYVDVTSVICADLNITCLFTKECHHYRDFGTEAKHVITMPKCNEKNSLGYFNISFTFQFQCLNILKN